MKIAIPIFKNRISPRLDVTDSILVYEINNNIIKKEKVRILSYDYPAELISFLQKKRVKQVICGGCPQFFLRILIFYGFDVAAGLRGDPEHILKLFIEGKIKNLSYSDQKSSSGRRFKRRKHQWNRNK